MRTISLELLRHGPPHNQLLSPLTQYLALCENHPAVTVQVPFEHGQLRHRLDNLCYRNGEAAREFEARDIARMVGDLFAQIPGLTAELGRARDDSDTSTHLRLIISSSELALIPFEIALAPNGFPGAGQPLSLQTQSPICMTREVRRVADTPCNWSRPPRILVIAANPAPFSPVPLAAHLLALRTALEPWLPPFAATERFRDFVKVLPQASDVQIENACAREEFTHVHILAHGTDYEERYDTRYGLALHDPLDPDGPISIVGGERLASILRPALRPDGDRFALPGVVTLASCNSANGGDVSGMGASVAHALHQAGIPVVVSSQFPLSFGGSVRMVEALYDGLLWGVDPRVIVGDLRRRLHSQFPDNHDWASITAYAALPPPFRAALLEFKLKQAKRCAEAAFRAVDRMAMRFYEEHFKPNSESRPVTEEEFSRMDAKVTERIDLAKDKLRSLLASNDFDAAMIYGQLASIEKRLAEIKQKDATESARLLRESMACYWSAFQSDRSNSWGLVQHLSLSVVLSRLNQLPNPALLATEAEKRHWRLAHAISEEDRKSPDIDISGWAIGNLIELHLLAVIMGGKLSDHTREQHAEEALRFADALVEKRGSGSFEVFSTRRQMARYAQWYNDIAVFEDPNKGSRLSLDLVARLPSTWSSDEP